MPNAQVRRATIDDLQQLAQLWEEEHLPKETLEKRFKEFQLATGEDGQILGAIGLEISGLEGHLHSEAFAHPEHADDLRNLLWDRLQIQAQNHGLVRIWSRLAASLPSPGRDNPHTLTHLWRLRRETILRRMAAAEWLRRKLEVLNHHETTGTG